MVVVLGATLLVFGIIQLRGMSVDILPEYAQPYVEVQTEALGLATAEVESLLTVPLEELLSGIPWLETIRSKSVPGLSSIVLIFEPGTDLMNARQLVRERLGLTFYTLPNVTKAPTMLQPLSVTSRVMMIGLSSEELSLIEMSVLARWNIKPRLMGIPGVANVSIWGQRRRQLQVQVDPEQLRAQGATLDQVIRSTGNSLWFSPLEFLNASYPGSGGWIDTPQQRLGIRHVLPISRPETLAQVSVDGTPLTLGDTGQVVVDHPPLIGDAVLNSGPGLLLIVEKFPGANTLEVTRQVDDALAALQLGLPGMEVDTQVFRSATFIDMALDNLGWALLIGAVFVVLVLGAFLLSWRSAVISITAIALSLVAAGLVLHWREATANVMVLAGFMVALGVIVDDSIVDVENIMRRLRHHRTEGSPEVDRCRGTTKLGAQCKRRPVPGSSYCFQHRVETNFKSTATIVLEASLEMRGPLLLATLILLLTVVPLFVLQDQAGAFFEPLAVSYALALVISMAVALTITPALSMLILSNAQRDSPIVRGLQDKYGGVLSRAIHTRAAYVIMVVLLIGGLAVWPLLRPSLLPSFQETDFVIQWEGTPGTSHPEMTRATNRASQELQAIPGVLSVNANVGRAVLGDEVVGINSAELWVSIDPEADAEATVAAIQETIEQYPGSILNMETYLQERIKEVLSGPSLAFGVRIYGPDLEVLRATAEEVSQTLAEIDGISDLTVEPQTSEPQVEIKVDLAKAQRFGLVPGDIRRAAATLVAGLEVGSLYEQQKVFDVVVWSVPDARDSLKSIRELLIDTSDGGHVRLGDVADVRVTSTPNAISREANSRRIDIGFNVRGRGFDSVIRDVEARLERIEFPFEHHPELIGAHAERQTDQQRILVAAVAVVAGIYLLLQAALQSWRLAAIAMLSLLAALAGGVIAAYLSGGLLLLGSLMGLIGVLAIATRSTMLLIKHYQVLEEHEGETFGPELILRGTRERLVPILMTGIATALALLPLVLQGAVAGLEIAQPMAIVIMGGIVASILVSLFVVPTLYLRFAKSHERLTVS